MLNAVLDILHIAEKAYGLQSEELPDPATRLAKVIIRLIALIHVDNLVASECERSADHVAPVANRLVPVQCSFDTPIADMSLVAVGHGDPQDTRIDILRAAQNILPILIEGIHRQIKPLEKLHVDTHIGLIGGFTRQVVIRRTNRNYRRHNTDGSIRRTSDRCP